MPLRNQPVFLEQEPRESVQSRTEALPSLRDLGPPDLCNLHIVTDGKSKSQKQIFHYHFCTGVDVSSSASVAAYMNSLIYQLTLDDSGTSGGNTTWFPSSNNSSSSASSNANSGVQLKSGIYCCWNAFSRMDIRVEIKIPGGVEAYAVDGQHGYKINVSEQLWLETYVCGMLRALAFDADTLLYPDERWNGHSVPQNASFYQQLLMQLSVKNINPFPSMREEQQFLDAVRTLFPLGWKLGCEYESQQPTAVNNHMVRIVHHYFMKSQRHEKAVEFWSYLLKKYPELGTYIVQNMLALDRHQDAVKLLHSCQLRVPLRSSLLLKTQAQFLWRDKGRPDYAAELFKFAIQVVPSDAESWLSLSELYFEQELYEQALSVLNSCPMFLPMQGTTVVLIPDSQKTAVLGGVQMNFLEILRSTPAPAKKRFPANEDAVIPPEIHEDAKTLVQQASMVTSPTGLPMTIPALLLDPLLYFSGNAGHRDACDIGLYRLQAPLLHGNVRNAYNLLAKYVKAVGWDALLQIRSSAFVMEEEYNDVKDKITKSQVMDDNVQNPTHPRSKPTSANSPRRPSSEGNGEEPWRGSSQLTVSMFDKKRLCERWLDNLFLILFEDLRAYTIFRAEIQEARNQKRPYDRTPFEWELLGDLCVRLHQYEEAKECYQFYVEQRYSFRIWAKLLQLFQTADRKDHLVLSICEKLISALDRWKWADFFTPTNPVVVALNQIVQQQGIDKTIANIQSMRLPKRNEQLFLKILEWLRKFS